MFVLDHPEEHEKKIRAKPEEGGLELFFESFWRGMKHNEIVYKLKVQLFSEMVIKKKIWRDSANFLEASFIN